MLTISGPLRTTRSPNTARQYPELFARVVDKYSDKQCFGLRQVFDVKEEPLPNGRTLRKWTLGDYQWQTYRQVFRSVRATHLGLTRVGIRAGDIVMLYADTRLEWMVSCQALFRLGATVGTLYTNLGEEGIVHAINRNRGHTSDHKRRTTQQDYQIDGQTAQH